MKNNSQRNLKINLKKGLISFFIIIFPFSISGCNYSVPQPLPFPGSSSQPLAPPTPSSVSDNNNSEEKTLSSGNKVLFMSNRSGFWDLYIMDEDGKNQNRLTNHEMLNPFPFSVSPDNKKVAFISDKSGNPDLWVLNISNMNIEQLTETELADEGTPTWSANGEKIIFHSNINSDYYRILEINYPYDEFSDSYKVLLSEEEVSLLHPSVSPNGTYILYTKNFSDGTSVLSIYDTFNKESINVTKSSDQAVNGSWFNDSKRIIFWTTGNGFFSINYDGTDKERISTVKNNKGTPFVSPNDQKIVISRGFGFSEDYNVWILDIDGRSLKKLTDLGGISLGWLKTEEDIKLPSSSPTNTPSTTPSPNQNQDKDENPYLDPEDPLINP